MTEPAPSSVPDEAGRVVWDAFVSWTAEQPGMAVRREWEDLSDEEHELYERIYSAAAARAVKDAKLHNERLEAQVFALGANLPAIRRALTKAAGDAEYESQARPYRTALQALGISDGEEP